MSVYNNVTHSLNYYYKVQAGIPVPPAENCDDYHLGYENIPGGEKTWWSAVGRCDDLGEKIMRHGGNVWEYFNLISLHGPTGRWRDWEKWCRKQKIKPFDLARVANDPYLKCTEDNCTVCVCKRSKTKKNDGQDGLRQVLGASWIRKMKYLQRANTQLQKTQQ